MSTYLVTGGAGFIGSHLCDALLARGDTVRVLDNLSTGRRANLPPSATLIEGDITDPITVADAIDGIDGCFHLAAIASVGQGITDWIGTHRTNLGGFVAVLDAIRRQARHIPVVYASSAAVYGDAATLPIAETTECRPLSAYGADKYGCELHAAVASHVHAIPTTGLRFFNVYGPRQDPGSPYSGVISIFCRRIAAAAPVTIFGDGQQTRDFIYVADVVAALLAAMASRSDTAAIFNVCTGIPTQVRTLARLIAERAGKPLHAHTNPVRTGEIRHSIGLPARADALLRLPERLPLPSGLDKVLAWMTGSPPSS
jgi:UDP-glucose 4-epimerase